MRINAFALSALLLLSLGFGVGAEDPKTLSLDECLRRGEESNRGLRASALKTVEDAARADEARRLAFPSLTLSGAYTRLSEVPGGTLSAKTPAGTVSVSLADSPVNSYSFKAAVQQPIYTGARIASTAAQALSLQAASSFDFDRTRQSLRASIETAYWSLALASDSLKVIDENIRSVESRLNDARNSFALGLIAKSETLKIESQLAGVRMLKTENENAIVSARARLNLLIGLPWDAPTSAVGIPAEIASTPLPPLEKLIEVSYSKRPEIGSSRSRLAAAEAGVKMARSGLFPSAYLVGDATIANPNQRVFPQKEEFTTTWSIGVVVSLDAGKIPTVLAQTRQAQARLDQAAESAAMTRDSVAQELVNAYLSVVSARKRLETSAAAVALSEELSRNAEDLFSGGLALSSERGDSELQLLSARLDYAKSRVGVLNAAVALSLAVGVSAESVK